MNSNSQGVVIVGGGQAGLSTAEHLRKNGYEGPVTILAAESHAPYQRPPLSKSYLLGQTEPERLLLKPLDWYEAKSVTLRLGAEVAAIDRAARTVTLQGGEVLGYGDLVLATGAIPRKLPAAIGGDLAGVHTLRGMDDIDRLRPELTEGGTLLVVGGGYIGLEMAAVGRKLGMNVIVLETAPRVLCRVASLETAQWITDLHLSHGVDIRAAIGLDRLEGDSRVRSAVLSEGSVIAVDCVVAGIGAAPDTRLAEAVGLATGNGIAVDATGRTSDPHIWAAGDCACYTLPSGPLRLESVGNAIDTAAVVARAILGEAADYHPQPWFWSDQYDAKLQIAGCFAADDQVVIRETPREGRSHWYFRNGNLVAVDAMNSPSAYMLGKRMLAQNQAPLHEHLRDENLSLKEIAQSAASAA